MKPETGSDVVDAVLHAAHRIRTAADANLRDRGLSLPSFKLLRALSISDMSMRQISEVLHLSPRTVTDMIDSLESRGLVTRGAHPSDRRVTLLRLTPAGTSQLADARAAADLATAAAIAELAPGEQETLRTLLERVQPDGTSRCCAPRDAAPRDAAPRDAAPPAAVPGPAAG